MNLIEAKQVMTIVGKLPQEHQEEAWTLFACMGLMDKEYTVYGLHKAAKQYFDEISEQGEDGSTIRKVNDFKYFDSFLESVEKLMTLEKV